MSPSRNVFAIPGASSAGLHPIGDQATERRVVTILFCDVAGSTAMAEVLDPEEWAELMAEAFEYLIRPIERYGGTVTRLMGDAVLALFGAPHAHGDDPQRAILAALEIIESIQPLRERIRARHGLDFNVRAGINTGLVVVGAFGKDDTVEYTAMGDAINVAARLEELAEPGTVRIGEATYRLAAPYFDVEPVGSTSVRGKREPEQTYRVLRRKQADAALDFSPREMPFTGRDAELALIRGAIDELRFEGRGRIIAISGEAGVGKSRLVDAVIDYVKSRPSDDGGLSIALLENRVNPYEETRPYAGLQARFRKVFGIGVNDSSDEVRRKFIERTSQFPEEFRERAAHIIQRVMALDIDGPAGDDEALFAPEEFKAELTAVVVQIVRGWNPDGAFMLVGEDYQWGDYASLEVVSQLYALLHDRPVLFLCTFRPMPDAPMTRIFETVTEKYADHLLTIDLAPLAADESSELVGKLIEGDSPEARRVREVILQRAEGNPLFIEELVQALAEQGALERIDGDGPRWRVTSAAGDPHLSLPTSLQALLLERIDRLPAAARRTLQQAAVLGRTFNRRVLCEVVQVDGDLENHLTTLMQLEMVRGLNGDADETLTFRHTLIQETAYNTILLRHRRHFHRRAAEAIERLFADRLSEYASDIGMHYYRAGDSRGIDWLVRAAEHAQAVYEPELVIDYAGKALELADQSEQGAQTGALLLRGRARDITGDFDGAREDLETLVSVARSRGDMELKWEALLDLGTLWSVADYGLAGAYIRDALAIAHILGDEAKVAHSLNRIGNWYVNVGDPENARRAHEEAHAIFQRLDDASGLAETVDLVGLARYLSADFGGSAESFRQAAAMFRELNDSRGLSSSLAMLTFTGSEVDTDTAPPSTDNHAELLGFASEAVEIARSISWSAGESFALLAAGELKIAHGTMSEGIADVMASYEIARRIDHRQWTLANIAAMGSLALDLFNYERSCEHLTDALARARELGSAYWTSVALSRLVDWNIAHGDLQRAAELLDSAIDPNSPLEYVGQRKLWLRAAKLAAERGDANRALDTVDRLYASAPGMRPGMVIPALSIVKGMALLRADLTSSAIDELRGAAERASSGNDWLRELSARVVLAPALIATGREEQASAERRRMQEITGEVARQLPAGEWRDAFHAGARKLLSSPRHASWAETG